MQLVIPQLVYAVWCVFFAYMNYRLIEVLNERVLHGINGIFHVITCMYFFFEVDPLMGLAMFFSARVVFDTSLNLMRKRGIGYVPVNPKSIFDKAEKWAFRNNGIVPKIVYTITATILNYFLLR